MIGGLAWLVRAMPSVQGRRVLVTGAATGLGREIALLLGAKGAHTILWDINAEELERTAADVRSLGKGGEVTTQVVNLADGDAIAACAKATGPVWGVVSNAGIVDNARFLDSTNERCELVYKVNAFAQQHLARAFLPEMIRQNDGAFISVSSIGSYISAPRLVTYCATKAAARVFIEALAQEVAAAAPGVHLGVCCPSATETALFKGFREHDADFLQRLLPPMKPTDVARAIVEENIEQSVPMVIVPRYARFSVILFRALVTERLWRKVTWRALKDVMTNHDPAHADSLFKKMAGRSKL